MNAVTERISMAEALPPEPPAVDSPGWQTVLARRWGATQPDWQRAQRNQSEEMSRLSDLEKRLRAL